MKNFVLRCSYVYPNLLITNPKLDLEYLSYHSYDVQSYDELFDLVTNSTVYDTLPAKQLDRFIYNLTHEDEKYTREIQELLNDLLDKRGIQRRDKYYLEIINKWYFSVNFDFVENDVFNWSISVYYSKINRIHAIKDLVNKIQK